MTQSDWSKYQVNCAAWIWVIWALALLVMLGLTTFTSFPGHRHVRIINCKLHVLDSCRLWLKILYGCCVHWKDHTIYDLFDSGVYSREIISMFLFGQVSGLVKNSNTGILSDTVNVTCWSLHYGTAHWALPVHTTFSGLECMSGSQQC